MDVAHTTTMHVSPDDARSLPNDAGHPSVRMMSHGSMELRWYRPEGEERHYEHDRNEIYFVVAGAAAFERCDEAGPFEEERLGLAPVHRVTVKAGDVVFVPAGSAHRFFDLSPDFALWTVFYGPEGGEAG